MGNTAGFLEYTRCENPLRPEAERVLDFEDLHTAQGQEIRCFDIDLHISFGTPEEYAAAVGDPRLHEVEQG